MCSCFVYRFCNVLFLTYIYSMTNTRLSCDLEAVYYRLTKMTCRSFYDCHHIRTISSGAENISRGRIFCDRVGDTRRKYYFHLSWIPWNLSFRYILFHEKRLQMMLWHHNTRVNSHPRWKQTRFRVCFHLWCELTSTMNVTEWQVSWNSCRVIVCTRHGLGRASCFEWLMGPQSWPLLINYVK